MKFLKILTVLVLSAVVTSAFAANTAKAYLIFSTVGGELYSDDVKLFEDDADILNTEDIYNSISDYCVNAYAIYESVNYSKVKIADLNGLVIKFKANNHHTNYTLSFSDLAGEAIKLQRGQEIIEMNEPYEFTCALNEEITFTIVMPQAPAADYERPVTAGNWGTICLPKASSSFSGMDLYEVAGYVAADNAIALDPMTTEQMVAGMPYIFQAKDDADMIEVNYTGDAAAAQEGANHLVGVLDEEGIIVSGLSYIVKDNKLWQAQGAHVAANRAYIDLEDITEMTPASAGAPGRKFIAVPRGAATDMQEVKAMEGTRKAIVNGRLVIIREGRMFNALGGMK